MISIRCLLTVVKNHNLYIFINIRLRTFMSVWLKSENQMSHMSIYQNRTFQMAWKWSNHNSSSFIAFRNNKNSLMYRCHWATGNICVHWRKIQYLIFRHSNSFPCYFEFWIWMKTFLSFSSLFAFFMKSKGIDSPYRSMHLSPKCICAILKCTYTHT